MATLPGFGKSLVPREPDRGEPERGGNGAERHLLRVLLCNKSYPVGQRTQPEHLNALHIEKPFPAVAIRARHSQLHYIPKISRFPDLKRKTGKPAP